MEVMQIKKIINDNSIAKEESFEFFEEVKEHGLYCKEIMVTSNIDKLDEVSFSYKNVLLKNIDIRIRENGILVDVEDKFAFSISNDGTNYKYNICDTEDGTILNISYTIKDKIKNTIYISF